MNTIYVPFCKRGFATHKYCSLEIELTHSCFLILGFNLSSLLSICLCSCSLLSTIYLLLGSLLPLFLGFTFLRLLFFQSSSSTTALSALFLPSPPHTVYITHYVVFLGFANFGLYCSLLFFFFFILGLLVLLSNLFNYSFSFLFSVTTTLSTSSLHLLIHIYLLITL